MIEVQNDAMGDRPSEKSGPTAGEKAVPTAGNVGRSEPEMTSDTRATMCTRPRKRSTSHSRSPRGVDSLIFDARVKRTLRRLNRCSCDIPVVVTRQAPMAQDSAWNPKQLQFIDKTVEIPGPDAEADPSGSTDSGFQWHYSDRDIDVPAWQDREKSHRRDPYGRQCQDC